MSALSNITFECEIITPMFLTGADGSTPEIRPPSIKGMMRFWWRAIQAEDEIHRHKLKERESAIFGSSEREGRSKVIVRIKKDLQYDDNFKYWLLPHKKKANQPAFSCNKKFKIEFILTEKEIKINGEKIFDLEMLKGLFELVVLLGGFGKRSRRGFGSVEITHIDNNEYTPPNNVDGILPILNLQNSNAYNIINGNKKITLNKNIALKYPFIKEIQVGERCSSNDELLKKIGQATSDVRKEFGEDANSLGFINKNNGKLASPIYVSIIQSNDSYCPIITTLNTAFKNPIWNVSKKAQQYFKDAILL